MEDTGRHLADQAAAMASEAAATTSSELRKRRSTRIVQAVPLSVMGVDALGRPFTERTSSLIINCHGCRYQSKHYVLKNMWVNLEIPHPESGQPARAVRGRVAWIQRPRTVRQLFQVALELETPGNVWGIGFPPPDWFSYTGGAVANAQLAAAAATPSLEKKTDAEKRAEAHETSPASASEIDLPLGDATAPGEPNNLRVFPSPANATDASMQLARQMSRLIGDAKQQIQAATREAAAQAVSAERRVQSAEWEQKLADARDALSRELSDAIDRFQRESESHSRAAQHSASQALRDDLPRWIAPQLEGLTRDLAAQLSQEALTRRGEQLEKLSAAAKTVEETCERILQSSTQAYQRAEKSLAELSVRTEANLQALDNSAQQQEATLKSRVESLDSASLKIEQQISATLAAAQAGWRAHLNGELEAAELRWQIAIDNAMTNAEERIATSLNERSEARLARFREEAEQLVQPLRDATFSKLADSELRLTDLQDSISAQIQKMETATIRAEEVSTRLGNFADHLENVRERALNRFQLQLDDVLSIHLNEMHQRSCSLCEEITASIRQTFEDSRHAAVSHFDRQIDSLIQPHIARTEEAVQRLAGGRSLLDAALALQQERIRVSVDEAFAESVAQFQNNLGGIEQILQQAAESVAARSLADFENRTDSLKREAVDDLVKSAEWYQKKAQTQIHGIAEKVGEQTASNLRKEAADVTGTFTGELDNSSRQFVNHAQAQMEEAVRESFERARVLFGEAAETTSAAFLDEIQRNARQELDGFEGELRKSSGEAQTQMNAAHTELSQQVTAEQKEFLRRFEITMNGSMQVAIADAQEKVQSKFSPLLEYWKAIVQDCQEQTRVAYEKVGETAAAHHGERLENVSNQWMLATVASLDRRSREVLASVAHEAEQRLRETCTAVFAELGESFRERLKQIAGTSEAADTPSSNQ